MPLRMFRLKDPGEDWMALVGRIRRGSWCLLWGRHFMCCVCSLCVPNHRSVCASLCVYTQYALLHSIWLYIVISLYKVGTPFPVPRRSSLRQDDSFPRVTRRRLWVPDLNLWRLFSEAQAEEHPGASESKVSVGPQTLLKNHFPSGPSIQSDQTAGSGLPFLMVIQLSV